MVKHVLILLILMKILWWALKQITNHFSHTLNCTNIVVQLWKKYNMFSSRLKTLFLSHVVCRPIFWNIRKTLLIYPRTNMGVDRIFFYHGLRRSQVKNRNVNLFIFILSSFTLHRNTSAFSCTIKENPKDILYLPLIFGILNIADFY